MSQMIDNNLWETLIAFDQYGTLSAAAEKLYVSQPSLSAAMKRLEKQLGVTLFDRRKNRIVLNEVGEEAVQLAKKHLADEKAMVRQLQERARRLSAITVASFVAGLRKTLVDRLSNMYPERSIISEHLSSELLPRGLLDGAFDFVITEYAIDEPEVLCAPYITDRLMVRVRADDPLASRESLTLQDLQGTKLLMWTQSGFWATLIRKSLDGKTSLVYVSDEQEYRDIVQAFDMRSFILQTTIINIDPHHNYCYLPLDEDGMQVTFYLSCLPKNSRLFFSLLPSQRC